MKKIQFEIDLLPGSIDNVCESFNIGSGVDVSGIIGTDFLDKNKYIIDFKRHRIWHNLRYVSFKEAMELIKIPFIVLWQEDRKYIFILDTASTYSHISTKAMKTLDFKIDTSRKTSVIGAGGVVSSEGIVTAKFRYK